MIDEVLRGYAAVSSDWSSRCEAITCEQLFGPVEYLIPALPSRVLDIGAGTGRDAAWLAGKGHRIVAVEPVMKLREAGIALHDSSQIEWVDDRLPDLSRLESGVRFDLVLLIGVWQHLNGEQRRAAMRRLAELTIPGGMLILSLRHGPGAPDRPVHPIRPEETVRSALDTGFTCVRERGAASVQAGNCAAGVHWTWLVFRML